MTTPNHLDNFTLNFLLDPPLPRSQTVFDTVLVVVDAATNTLGGDTYRTYTGMTGSTGVEADQTAGLLSANVAEGARVAFTQKGAKLPKLIIVKSDFTLAADLVTALAAFEDLGVGYYGAAIESRDDAFILAFSAALEARDRLFAMQTNNADLYTGALSASTLAALDGRENTIGCWHDEDTDWMDLALLANRLAFNPDKQSVPWDTPLDEVGSYTAGATSTLLAQGHKDQLDSNSMNHGLLLGSETFHVDPGVNMANRPIYEIVTKHWFKARMNERLAKVKTTLSRRGQKLTIDASGQAKLLAQAVTLFQQGANMESPHFIKGQTLVEPYTITPEDRDAQRLRFRAAGTYAVSARKFEWDINFTRQLIFEEAA